jgi:hypothetical protein
MSNLNKGNVRLRKGPFSAFKASATAGAITDMTVQRAKETCHSAKGTLILCFGKSRLSYRAAIGSELKFVKGNSGSFGEKRSFGR